MRKVLFLCTGNSCRSQMAEGFLRHLGKGNFEVHSAGTRPSVVHPLTIKTMEEVGMDISSYRSKSVKEFEGRSFDYVITVCDIAKESCPVFPGKAQRIHWSFEDPVIAKGTEEERLNVFRKVRDAIQEKVKSFTSDLSKEGG